MTEISRRHFNLKSYQGGRKQSSNYTNFHVKLFSHENFLSVSARFNFTNADEPYFVLDMLELITARLIEENDSALIAVYAVNQKGRSMSVLIRDLELGATVKLDRGNEAQS